MVEEQEERTVCFACRTRHVAVVVDLVASGGHVITGGGGEEVGCGAINHRGDGGVELVDVLRVVAAGGARNTSPRSLLSLLLSVALTIGKFHEETAGAAHGDIRPENILFFPSDGVCILTDFFGRERRNMPPASSGKKGCVGSECDVFGWALLALEAVCGARWWGDDDASVHPELAKKMVADRSGGAPLPNTSCSLSIIIGFCVSTDPSARLTMREVCRGLSLLIDSPSDMSEADIELDLLHALSGTADETAAAGLLEGCEALEVGAIFNNRAVFGMQSRLVEQRQPTPEDERAEDSALGAVYEAEDDFKRAVELSSSSSPEAEEMNLLMIRWLAGSLTDDETIGILDQLLVQSAGTKKWECKRRLLRGYFMLIAGRTSEAATSFRRACLGVGHWATRAAVPWLRCATALAALDQPPTQLLQNGQQAPLSCFFRSLKSTAASNFVVVAGDRAGFVKVWDGDDPPAVVTASFLAHPPSSKYTRSDEAFPGARRPRGCVFVSSDEDGSVIVSGGEGMISKLALSIHEGEGEGGGIALERAWSHEVVLGNVRREGFPFIIDGDAALEGSSGGLVCALVLMPFREESDGEDDGDDDGDSSDAPDGGSSDLDSASSQESSWSSGDDDEERRRQKQQRQRRRRRQQIRRMEKTKKKRRRRKKTKKGASRRKAATRSLFYKKPEDEQDPSPVRVVLVDASTGGNFPTYLKVPTGLFSADVLGLQATGATIAVTRRRKGLAEEGGTYWVAVGGAIGCSLWTVEIGKARKKWQAAITTVVKTQSIARAFAASGSNSPRVTHRHPAPTGGGTSAADEEEAAASTTPGPAVAGSSEGCAPTTTFFILRKPPMLQTAVSADSAIRFLPGGHKLILASLSGEVHCVRLAPLELKSSPFSAIKIVGTPLLLVAPRRRGAAQQRVVGGSAIAHTGVTAIATSEDGRKIHVWHKLNGLWVCVRTIALLQRALRVTIMQTPVAADENLCCGVSSIREMISSVKHMLAVTVVGATGLPRMDLTGAADPYCILTLGDQTFRTQTKMKTRSPRWNEAFLFELPTHHRAAIATMTCEIKDYDRFGRDEAIGSVCIFLDEVVFDDDNNVQRFPITASKGRSNGHIFLSLAQVVRGAPSSASIQNRRRFVEASTVVLAGCEDGSVLRFPVDLTSQEVSSRAILMPSSLGVGALLQVQTLLTTRDIVLLEKEHDELVSRAEEALESQQFRRALQCLGRARALGDGSLSGAPKAALLWRRLAAQSSVFRKTLPQWVFERSHQKATGKTRRRTFDESSRAEDEEGSVMLGGDPNFAIRGDEVVLVKDPVESEDFGVWLVSFAQEKNDTLLSWADDCLTVWSLETQDGGVRPGGKLSCATRVSTNRLQQWNRTISCVALAPDGDSALIGFLCTEVVGSLQHKEMSVRPFVRQTGDLELINLKSPGAEILWSRPKAHSGGVGAVVILRHWSRCCLSAGDVGDPTIKLWRQQGGASVPLLTIRAHAKRVCWLDVSENEERVLSSSGFNSLRVWDLSKDGKCIAALEGARMAKRGRLNAPGTQALTTAFDNTEDIGSIQIFCCESSNLLWHAPNAHDGLVTGVAFVGSQDDPAAPQIVCSCSRDCTIKLWYVGKLSNHAGITRQKKHLHDRSSEAVKVCEAPLITVPHGDYVNDVAIDKSGRWIVSGSGGGARIGRGDKAVKLFEIEWGLELTAAGDWDGRWAASDDGGEDNASEKQRVNDTSLLFRLLCCCCRRPQGGRAGKVLSSPST